MVWLDRHPLLKELEHVDTAGRWRDDVAGWLDWPDGSAERNAAPLADVDSPAVGAGPLGDPLGIIRMV